jgi:S-adenosylmethionine hydrolase
MVPSTPPAAITLLTDFGLADHFVGVLKGVIERIAPGARVIDISHAVRPYALDQARFLLAQSWLYFPAGTVHVVVVDPGVGSARRAIVVETAGHLFVGPDNGVLADVLTRGDARVREIENRALMRSEISATFHGRDVFAPVAAHLAAGVAIAEVGPVIDDAVRLATFAATQIAADRWCGAVVHIDRFGNLITNLPCDLGSADCTIHVGRVTICGVAPNYAAARDDVPIAVAGSSGMLEIAISQGDAARVLGITVGARVELTV